MAKQPIYSENLREMMCCGESNGGSISPKVLLEAVKHSDEATKQQLKKELGIKEKDYEDVVSLGNVKLFPIEK